jgi:cytochrome c peroxidase
MHAFLDTLTDPCVLDRDCLAPWIPTPGEAPDENQLNAIDMDGDPL